MGIIANLRVVSADTSVSEKSESTVASVRSGDTRKKSGINPPSKPTGTTFSSGMVKVVVDLGFERAKGVRAGIGLQIKTAETFTGLIECMRNIREGS